MDRITIENAIDFRGSGNRIFAFTLGIFFRDERYTSLMSRELLALTIALVPDARATWHWQWDHSDITSAGHMRCAS